MGSPSVATALERREPPLSQQPQPPPLLGKLQCATPPASATLPEGADIMEISPDEFRRPAPAATLGKRTMERSPAEAAPKPKKRVAPTPLTPATSQEPAARTAASCCCVPSTSSSPFAAAGAKAERSDGGVRPIVGDGVDGEGARVGDTARTSQGGKPNADPTAAFRPSEARRLDAAGGCGLAEGAAGVATSRGREHDAERTDDWGSDSDDDSSAAAEAERLERLKGLSDTEKQSLVDSLLEAQCEADWWAALLEPGPEERKLGEAHPAVLAERVERELDLLQQARERIDEASDSGSGDEEIDAGDPLQLAAEFLEAEEAEWRLSYESALEQVSSLQEDVEACGIDLLALQKELNSLRDKSQPSTAPDASASGCGHQGTAFETGRVRCGNCSRLAELGSELCYVCSAEAEIERARPFPTDNHGQVRPRGADGFTGWTEGLRRTKDPTALKKMYRAKQPHQLERLRSTLLVDDTLDVDELSSSSSDAATGGASSLHARARLRADLDDLGDDSLSGSSSEDEAPLGQADGAKRRPKLRTLVAAWQSELREVPTARRRRRSRDAAERQKPQAACSVCSHPFFSCVEVHSHPLLGVALCGYCLRGISNPEGEPAASLAGDAEEAPAPPRLAEHSDDEKGSTVEELCMWCAGLQDDRGSMTLFACDSCNRWCCEACIRANLGDAEVSRVREASPWKCYACDPAPLAELVARCDYMRRRQEQQALRKEQQRERMRAKPPAARARRDHNSAQNDTGGAPSTPSISRPQQQHRTRVSSSPAADAARAAADEAALAAAQEEREADAAAPPFEIWPATRLVNRANRGEASTTLPAVRVLPRLARQLKAHQQDAVRFIWKACIGGKRQDVRTRKEHGCVLAHSMGLGKTLSVITFLHTALLGALAPSGTHYVQFINGKEPPEDARGPPTALVLVPKAVCRQWEREFRRWLIDASGSQTGALHLDWFRLDSSTARDEAARLDLLYDWHTKGGVLVTSHNLFQQMLRRSSRGGTDAARARQEEFEGLLLDPGADLLVMDEAHIIKNEKNKLAQALARVRTRRRVLLTGTPLQNNLVEYFHMVNSVKPGELGDLQRFKQLFEEIIQRGSVKSIGAEEQKRKQAASQRIWLLTKQLDKLVHRRGREILTRELPRLSSFVITLRQSELQRKLYNARLARVGGASKGLFAHKEDMLRIFNHPATLLQSEADAARIVKLAVPASLERTASRSSAAMAGPEAAGEEDDEEDAPEDPEAVSLAKAYEDGLEADAGAEESSAPSTVVTLGSFSCGECLVSFTEESFSWVPAEANPLPELGHVLLNVSAADVVAAKVDVGLRVLTVSALVKVAADGRVLEIPGLFRPFGSEEMTAVQLTFSSSKLLSSALRCCRRLEATVASQRSLHGSAASLASRANSESCTGAADACALSSAAVVVGTAVTSPSPWWHAVLSEPERRALTCEPALSGKAAVALELIRRAVQNDEKVLLFSQSLQTLQVLEEILKREPTPRPGATGNWQVGLDYLRLDGNTTVEEREKMMAYFSSPRTKIRLFIMSTKAGGLGVNLTAASRVILFDANWNPSHDVQAVCRAYRYGQRRPVCVYRLIAEGWEEVMYRQQVVKLQLAGRVLDEQTQESLYTDDELSAYLTPLPSVAERPAEPSAAGTSLPADSWLPRLCAEKGAEWILSVEDHNLQLEDTEEVLSKREQEEAANDLIRDANSMYREHAICESCGTQHFGVRFSQLSLNCACGAISDLPPAPPVVDFSSELLPGQLQWFLHGERPESGEYTARRTTLLPERGVYHVQWRELQYGEALGTEEGWKDGKHALQATRFPRKSNLNPECQYQVRVRARNGPCNCDIEADPDDTRPKYLRCDCKWTPWSLPSAPCTPIGSA